MVSRVHRWLTHPRLPLALAFLAMLLTLPSWRAGLALDDLIHRLLLLDPEFTFTDASTGLFTFLAPETVPQLMDLGVVPWWTVEEAHLSFFRPVSAFTHWLDYRIWPELPPLMHLHSILWYGAIGGLVAVFYRQYMGPVWLAGLAALLYIVDDGHVTPVSWLANRNALLALCFGLLTLLAHDRWRREGWKAGAILAPICLGLSSLSAEAGVATGGYLLAYAIVLDRGTWLQRLRGLMPHTVIGMAWMVAYRVMGFGTSATGLYIDPGREPVNFLAAILERGPILLFGQWGTPDSIVYSLLSEPAGRFMWVGVVMFVVLVGTALTPLLRKSELARYWALGMMLSVVTVAGFSIPADRLLLFAGIGGMGLLAQFLGGLLQREEWVPQARIWRLGVWCLGWLLILLHGVLAPIQLVAFSAVPADTRLEPLTDIGGVSEDSDVIVVNAPSPFHFGFLIPLREYQGQPTPAHTRILAPGHFAVEVTRLDSNTVLVRPENGYLPPPGKAPNGNPERLPTLDLELVFLSQILDRTFRSDGFPMVIGQRVELTGMNVEVTAVTEDGRASEVRVRFDTSLEDHSLKWLQWDWEEEAYVPFLLLSVGETRRVPGRY